MSGDGNKFPAATASALDWARWYIDAGTAPIPVPFKSKVPVLKQWPTLRLTRDTVTEHFNGEPTNVGLLWGVASAGLVDGDLDCPEAVSLAARFLPATPCLFGRESTGAAHWLWRLSCAVPTTKFEDVEKEATDGKRAMLAELRGEGAQTIVPGSVHPSGERVLFLCETFAPALVDAGDLLRRMRLLACACILARHWPVEGARHQAALGAAGLLLRAAVPVEDVVLVVTSAALAAGDSEARARRADVLSTHDKIEAGATVVGGGELANVLRGDGAAVVKRIKTWFGAHQSAEPRWSPPADRPEIDTGNLGLAEMGAAAWAAIERANDPPKVYRYGTALAWLAEDPAGRPQIEVMGQDHVRHHLAHVATFIRWLAAPGRAPVPKPAFPPLALAADLLAVPRGALPRLVRLVRVPVFTADGRLLTAPGYDAASGVYYAAPPGLEVPAVPAAPTAAEIGAARTLLLAEWLGDFPFVAPADRAHALALLLTLFLRDLIDGGDVPLFVVSKPTPRSGAGLLIKVVSMVQDGAPVAVTTASREEEEQRKRLTAALLPGPAMLVLDNLHGRLDSAALAAILTCGGTWEDRLLGHTQMVRVPVRSTLCVTGNNVMLSNEMTGRAVLIGLDPKMEDPSTRTGFRHPDLERWTLQERGRLLAAALTLGQAWLAAGRPRAAVPAFGGYQGWADLLGGVLMVAGVPGFLANRRDLFEQADTESAPLRAFLADWADRYGTGRVTTKELLDLAKRHDLPIEAKTDHGMTVRLGVLVRRLVGRPYRIDASRSASVRRGDDKDHSAVFWRLELGPAGAGGESHESGESPSVTRSARACECNVGVAEQDSLDSPDSPSKAIEEPASALSPASPGAPLLDPDDPRNDLEPEVDDF